MVVAGFTVIVVLYVVVGILAATGMLTLSQKIFRPRAEQIFYGAFLIPVAGFYLAFTAYFEAQSAWRTEIAAVLVFSVLGLAGARLPWVLILGYALHGTWDAVHELAAHGAGSVFEAGRLTDVPLAYGFFCAALDFCIAAYFYRRRSAWAADWKSS
jgi:hypothetical protein